MPSADTGRAGFPHIDHESPAAFSGDRRHRYVLRRTTGLDGGSCTFIMLNPSTADEETDDPTVRRAKAFAHRWGFGAIEVVNLFALRSTDPRALTGPHAIGYANDRYIWSSVRRADMVVCAWGNHGALFGRSSFIMAEIDRFRVKLHHLGLTASGEPRHPLYLRKKTEPIPFHTEGP